MTWTFLCKVTFPLKALNSPWVVASVDRGEGAEGHIVRALAVLRWAVKIPISYVEVALQHEF